MTIRAEKDRSGNLRFRIDNRQRCAGQRTRDRFVHWFQAMLAGGRAVAIRVFQRCQGSRDGRAPFMARITSRASRAVAHQRPGGGSLDSLQFRIDGHDGDLSVRGVDTRLGFAHDLPHRLYKD